jgi:hypothetical protein
MLHRACLVTLLVLFVFFPGASCLVHHLTIKEDDRALFKIETFGFFGGGHMNLTINSFYLSKKNGSPVHNNNNNKDMRIGFVMRRSTSESASQQDLEHAIEKKECILDHASADDFMVDISDESSWAQLSAGHIVAPDRPGLYSLLFARCRPTGSQYVNFQLDVSFINPGPNYLSAGDTPLPAMYFGFFFVFTAALVVWCWVLTRDAATNGTVHRIHFMMALLLALKCLTLLSESIRFHYIAIVGSQLAVFWSVVYYIFAFLKGIMLFTVILLIGSGWSLMKAYLNDREKKIVLVVLTLQVLDNVAMVVLEETAPGSQGWLRWRDVLHLVDIVCCCAILFPIVWSIRHLRQAAEADGKAQRNLLKLQLFRQFYVMVVAYIYFTRIVVYVIAATIPFYLLWLGNLATELATLIFFVSTGIKFSPSVDNPYLPVSTGGGIEGEEDSEYGLGGDGSDEGVGDEEGSASSRTRSPVRPEKEANHHGLELVAPSRSSSSSSAATAATSSVAVKSPS